MAWKPTLLLAFMLLSSWIDNNQCVAFDRETPVVKAVRMVGPAVVNISSQQQIRTRANPFHGLGLNPFFDSFFNDFFDSDIQRSFKKTSLGSGVIIDGERGYILTNSHVIANTGTIAVTLKDEREFEAQIVGADPDSDLAVLRIKSEKPLPAVKIKPVGNLMIGETVIAIGNPFGFSHTVTTGVISAVNRSVRTENKTFHDFIQTDASINPGNSGGPLLNINGELIGINTVIYAKAQGIGFAIPINKAQKIVSDLIRYGEVVPAWIGITVQKIDAALARYLNLPDDTINSGSGVLVKMVTPGSPAHSAGIKRQDVILSISRFNISSSEDYQSSMREFAAGDTLELLIYRNGEKYRIAVQAAVFPEALAMDLAASELGVTVENLTPENRLRYRTAAKDGVVITKLNRQYYLAKIGVLPGDVIHQVDEVSIKNIKDFAKAMVKYRQKTSLVILLQRGDQLYYLTVKK